MNSSLFSALCQIADDQSVDRFREPALPPLDMSEDALSGVAGALESLARALGLDAGVTICQPLWQEARSRTQIEMQMLNAQFALMRAMVLLGYDWSRLEQAMLVLIESGQFPHMKPVTPTAV